MTHVGLEQPSVTVLLLERLLHQRAWHEICESVSLYVECYTGHERARLHAALATAYFHRAQSRLDYYEALAHAHECRVHSHVNSVLHIWALHKITSLCVTLGRYRDAQRYGTRFLVVAHMFPSLAAYLPHVLRDLSHAHYWHRRYTSAIALRRKALQLFEAQGQPEEVLRTSLNLVWAYTKAKRLVEARAMLPISTPPHMQHLYLGAECFLLIAEKRHDEAWNSGRAAIDAARALHDFADAAEVAMLLAKIARDRGQHGTARALIHKAAELSARQGHDAVTRLVLRSRAEGHLTHRTSAPLAASERGGASMTTGVG